MYHIKVFIDLPNNEILFGIKILKSLSSVKNAKPMSKSVVNLWEDLKESAEKVQLHKQGKIKLKTAQEFLNELN